ncbi:MAG: hypothetical protein AB7N70_15555 [Dehalococcoidia bacterium]
MGFFKRLFGDKKQTAPGSPPQSSSKHGNEDLLSTVNDVECPHIDLGPHWDNAADLGNIDKASGYKCGGCNRLFSIEEARVLRETEVTRLTWMQEGQQSTAAPADGPPSAVPPGDVPSAQKRDG